MYVYITKYATMTGYHMPYFTYGLDASHPEVVDYIEKVFRQLREWGVEFFKVGHYACIVQSFRLSRFRNVAKQFFWLFFLVPSFSKAVFWLSSGAQYVLQ